MSNNILETAFNPDAPLNERDDAMRMAQSAYMPSSVQDMLPMIKYMQEQYEEQGMYKALEKNKLIPVPQQETPRTGKSGMQSIYLDNRRIQVLGDYYERPGAFHFELMRTMVDRTPVLSAVIMTRQRQVKRFCRVQESGKGPGFAIKLKDTNQKLAKDEQESIQALESFFTNCGWEQKARVRARLKRDNFSQFMAKNVRDSLVMDSAPIELEWKKDKKLGFDGFYSVDGSTIRLCTEEGYRDDDEVFALQVVQGSIVSAYTHDDLIYVPRNPRTDVSVGGYGLSETELLVQTVTGFLNAMSYNLNYFNDNNIPKGMLHLSGDYSQEDLYAFKRYWNAMVKGINNAWTLPVMVSKNQESKAAFEKFGVDVDDVMFAKWMTFLTSIICAIYGIGPDEINFESFSAGNTSALAGKDTEEKLINSKDKGLRPLLSHYEDLFSDYIVSEFGDKYVFRFTGLDEQDPQQAWTEEQALCTVNEARKARGWNEITEDWGDAPLNQTLMGAFMQGQQSGQEDYGNPNDSGQFGGLDDQDSQGKTDKQDNEDQDKPDNRDKPDTGDKPEEQDKPPIAKSFGLPVWSIEP